MIADNPSPFLADEPSRYPKRVLLAVCGLSPQIVTETLYALATAQTPFIPTEVRIITTREGAQKAIKALSKRGDGWLHRLLQDYGLPDLSFESEHIHVLQTPDGRDIEDIRTVQDNQYTADFITATVRRHTLEPDSALHVSIAGGRKTMGFYLGYALSLYGRHQDRLSHVLVNAPYENSPDFYYPTPYASPVQLRDGSQHDAHDAQVALAVVPFVSLRHGLPNALLEGEVSFNATVKAIAAGVTPPQLDIDLKKRRIRASGVVIELPPSELAFLSMFARLALELSPALGAPKKDAFDLTWSDRYLKEYKNTVQHLADIQSVEKALKNGMDGAYFSERKSRLARRLKSALHAASDHYCVQRQGRPGKFSLPLPVQAIRYCSIDV